MIPILRRLCLIISLVVSSAGASAFAKESTLPSSSSLGGIALGSSFITAVRTHGLPSSVLTGDLGHIFTWDDAKAEKLRLSVDDDGIVRMIDELAMDGANRNFTVASDPPLHVAFGKFTVEQSEENLSSLADFSGVGGFPDTGAKAEFRAYKLAPQIELVMLFDSGNILREALLGQRAMLARSGLLPGAQIQGPHFSAPVLQHEGSADYPRTRHQGDAILRIAVNNKGKVSDAVIVVSTGDGALDRAAVNATRGDVFLPARFDNIAVSAFVFRKEEFRVLPPSH